MRSVNFARRSRVWISTRIAVVTISRVVIRIPRLIKMPYASIVKPRPSYVLLGRGDIGVAVDHVNVGVGNRIYTALHMGNKCTSGSVVELDLEIKTCASLGEISSRAEGEVCGDGVGTTRTSRGCILDIS